MFKCFVKHDSSVNSADYWPNGVVNLLLDVLSVSFSHALL